MEELDKDLVDKLNIIFSSTSLSLDLIEYKEIEDPCVALTIIGENRLTNTVIFAKRSARFSFKTFFSTLVLTVMNMFI